MATIVTRAGKGSPLTNAECDANITNLNTDKVEKSGDTLTGDLAFGDNVKAKFGASDDLQIYHDGSDSYLADVGTGNLKLLAGSLRIRNGADTADLIEANNGGAVRLYHNNSAKFATTSSGVDITGTVVADGLIVDGGNAIQLNASSGTDSFKLIQGGTQAVIIADSPDGAGNLLFRTTAAGVNTDRLQITAGGDLELYEDTGTTAKLTWDASAEELQFKDNVNAEFGDSGDLTIRHNGTDGIITNFTNDLQIINSADDKDVRILADNGSGGLTNYLRADGSEGELQLFHYGSQKLATKSTGIDVTGTVTADGLTVDQSGTGTIGNVELKTISSFDTSNALPSIGRSTTSIGGSGTGTLVIQGRSDLPRSVIIATGDTSTSRFHENGDISFYDDAGTSQDFYWDASTSRLGLGTTSPAYNLEVRDSSNPTVAIIKSGVGGLYLDTNSSGTDATMTITASSGLSGQADLAFKTGGNTPSEAMRIDSSGNVGIGTASPSVALEVNGGDVFQQMIIRRGTSGTSSPILTFQTGDGTSAGHIGGAGADGLQLRTGSGAGTERMRIDSSGNVGIGTASPDKALVVSGVGAEIVINDTDTTDTPLLRFRESGSTSATIFTDGGNLIFTYGSTQAARIDSSGNLLVGKTVSNSATTGIQLNPDGLTAFTRNGYPPVRFNRLTSDGDIATFQKDGTTIGSIGVDYSDNLFLSGNSSHSGLSFGTDGIIPYANGDARDGSEDLGNGAYRWRNLYLSGGVYLGGTGSANLLDDYEEGQFTANLRCGGTTLMTTGNCLYTKVGRFVFYTIDFASATYSGVGANTGNVDISGLPFTSSGYGRTINGSPSQSGGVFTVNLNTIQTSIVNSTSILSCHKNNATGISNVTEADLSSSSSSLTFLRVSGFYQTS